MAHRDFRHLLASCIFAVSVANSQLAAALIPGGLPVIPGLYAVGAFSTLHGGLYVIGGFRDRIAGGYWFAVERITADGAVDTAYGVNGLALASVWGSYYEFAGSLALLPDGRIVVGGTASDPGGSSDPLCHPALCRYNPALVRFNADGSVDPTFNGNGKLVLAIGAANDGDVGEFGDLSGMQLQPDGKIVIFSGTTATARVNQDGTLDATFVGTSQVAREVTTVDRVVEYYNASLDHYFMTWVPSEILALDNGPRGAQWVRTGKTFHTYTKPQAGTSTICRFYIPPDLGDSHFFGRDPGECDATRAKYPNLVLEDEAFMDMALPVGGVCPIGNVPVYRVFSNRSDANHRYTTDPAVRDEMANRGWLAEGDGPDRIAMCAPR